MAKRIKRQHNFLLSNPTNNKLQQRLIVNTVFENTTETTKWAAKLLRQTINKHDCGYLGPSINDITLFWAKIYPLPPCHISSQVFNPHFKYSITIRNPPLTFAITNFHIFCVCLDKIFICFIDLICARCGNTNILFVKCRKHCTHCEAKSKVFSTLLKTETNELRCANAGNDWLRLYSCAWIYRSGRFAILNQKQIIGIFCSIVYLQERFHNTVHQTSMACKCNTGR